MKAYANSKLACLMFAFELDRRLTKNNYQVRSMAAHPGVTLTNIHTHLSPILESLGHLFSPWLLQSTDHGIKPVLAAALSSDALGGDYYGPRGWREWRGEAIKVDSSEESKNQQLSQELWDASIKLTGASYPF